MLTDLLLSFIKAKIKRERVIFKIQHVNKTKTNQMFRRITLPGTETWKHVSGGFLWRGCRLMPNSIPAADATVGSCRQVHPPMSAVASSQGSSPLPGGGSQWETVQRTLRENLGRLGTDFPSFTTLLWISWQVIERSSSGGNRKWKNGKKIYIYI